MEPLNFSVLKITAHDALAPWRKAAGRTAACFFFVLGVLQFGLSLIADRFVALPGFESAEDMLQYFTSGHLEELMKLSLFNLLSFFLSLLFAAVFSAYCLKISQGSRPGGRTLLQSLPMLLRGFLLFVLFLAAIAVVSILLSLLGMLSSLLMLLAFAALMAGMLILLYALRLCLFTVADRKDCNVIAALKDSIRMTKGHKKRLLLLDLSFIWFYLLLSVISSVISSIPELVGIFVYELGFSEVYGRIAANGSVLTLVFSAIGMLAVLPIYYKFQTYVQLTYALAYQQLKEQQPPKVETQPLAYKEFGNSER